jgi:glutamate dehydrogenase
LRREIVTTKIVSRLVNRMGTTFTQQIGDETGADLMCIVPAWYAASEILDAEALWKEIEALDLKIPSARQMALMMALRDLVGAATRQILASSGGAGIDDIVETYRDAAAKAMATARAGQAGVDSIAALLDARSDIAGVFELVDLARAGKRSLEDVAASCTRIDAALDLAWFGNAIGKLPADNRWQARARAQLAGDLRVLRQSLLQSGLDDASTTVSVRSVIEELKRNAPQDLAMLSAGLGEIRRLFKV